MPKVSYRAEGPIRELRVNVIQNPKGTTIAVSWATRELGDDVLQGHRHAFVHESRGQVKSLAHAVNLALWGLRKVGGPDWKKVR